MYVVPIVLILLIAIGIFFGPLLAVILLVLALLALGAFKFLGGGAEPESAPSPDLASRPPGGTTMRSDEEEGGAWGETWPEEREEEQSGSERS
jgi:hypothetical protein